MLRDALRSSTARRSTISRPTTRRRNARAATCAASTPSWARAASSSARSKGALAATDETVGGVGRRLRILEIGCGDGRLMLEVARHRARALARGRARPARPPADRRSGDDCRLCRGRLAGAAADRRRARLGRRPRSPEHWDAGRRQPVPPSLRRRRLRRLLAGCARRADALRRLRAAAQPLRARRLAPDLLPRRQRGDAARRRAQRARRLRRPRAERCLASRAAPGDPLEPPAPGSSTNTTTASSPTSSAPRWSAAAIDERALRRRDRRRRPGRFAGGDPAGARRLVGGAGRAPALPAAQGLRRVHRREQPRAARRPRRRRRGRAPRRRRAAPGCADARRRAWSRRCRRPRAAPRFGRALGREQLDTLLVRQAALAGATLFQPCALQSIEGEAGGFRLRLRSAGEGGADIALEAALVVAAHGSWEPLPSERAVRREQRRPSDLFAFKANFRAARSSPTCCRCCRSPAATAAWSSPTTASPRSPAASAKTGSAAIAKPIPASAPATCSRRSCAANAPASPPPWRRASGKVPGSPRGPIRPGVRLGQGDGIFRIGNAAGEAHPIVGEGISMAIQSAFVLAALLGPARRRLVDPDSAAEAQAALLREYEARWRQRFAPAPARRRGFRPSGDAARGGGAGLAGGARLARPPDARRALERQDALRPGGGAARRRRRRHREPAAGRVRRLSLSRRSAERGLRCRIGRENVSSASSDSRTSFGVPNTVVVLMNDSVPSGAVEHQRHDDVAAAAGGRPVGARAGDSALSSSCSARSAASPLAAICRRSRESRCARHSREVDDARRQAVGMQAQAQHVDRRLQQFRRARRRSAAARRGCARPASSGGRRRARARARAPSAPARPPRAPPPSPGRRGRARRTSARIRRRRAAGCARAAARRADSARRSTISRLGSRAAGLDEAQVARRDLGLAGEVELAQAAAQAPVAQQRADGQGGGGVCIASR